MADGVVHIVDDDYAVRDSLDLLLRMRGYRTRTYDSGEALLAAAAELGDGCIVLDLRMPGMSGLDAQRQLASRGVDLPIIMLTAHGDAGSARDALKGGAVEFLEKPADDSMLVQAIESALNAGRQDRSDRIRRAGIRERIDRLTPREREVLSHVLAGHHNREIAVALGISPRTVEVYKAKLLDKLQVERLPDLIRLALEAELTRPAGEDRGNP
jgi:RNA polymerase sigma factor (sigma-70 family)